MSPRSVNLEEDDRFASVSAPMVNGDHLIASTSTSLQGILSFIPVLGSSTMPSSSSSSSSSSLVNTAPSLPPPQDNPNPYPFPPWYPESAHFVRQWWPSLVNIPRVSCTVVLLATHDQDTHRTRFVLAQHYFRVPLNRREWESDAQNRRIPVKNGKQVADGEPINMNGKPHTHHRSCVEELQDEALMHLWYVSTPFEVVRVLDGPEEEEDDGTFMERPRPLVAVDFGHAVWIEYVDVDDAEMEDETDGDIDEGDENDGTMMDTQSGATPTTTGLIDSDPKRLRFVTFPPFVEEGGSTSVSGAKLPMAPTPSASSSSSMSNGTYDAFPRGVVHTLPTPPELQLGLVETINIDQSQGAVILSDKEGKIWILCYE